MYFDGSFPFLHQNKFRLDFGTSFPSNQGVPTLQVITEGQGATKKIEQSFETGLTEQSALIQTSCQYKVKTDHLDEKRFTDKYASCLSFHESPSMVNTSYMLGLIALIIAYGMGLPLGIAMAAHKDKALDKIGIAYINLLIAVPSLAFIFFITSGSAPGKGGRSSGITTPIVSNAPHPNRNLCVFCSARISVFFKGLPAASFICTLTVAFL
jgi:oligopeptide transport system permease protein